MSGQNPVVRPYCPGVRVGNWLEDIALEEVGVCPLLGGCSGCTPENSNRRGLYFTDGLA